MKKDLPLNHSSIQKRFKNAVLRGVFIVLAFTMTLSAKAQTHSVAREWNEALIFSIRKDFARPIVHARNLFHISMAMYDAWAVYSDHARPFFLGDTLGTYVCAFAGVPTPSNVQAAQEEAISYAAYRLIKHRFQNSPNVTLINQYCDGLMGIYNYPTSFTSTNYQVDGPAALGNYIAQQVIAYGLQDGAREANGYSNAYYQPVNPPLTPITAGTTMNDPNRWQSISLNVFIDQSGNVYPLSTPPFLGAEWGNVVPFSLQPNDKTVYTRNGNTYNVYKDAGAPPYLVTPNGGGTSAEWQWNFQLVGTWSSHLDTAGQVMQDISPNTVGNTAPLPTTFSEYQSFYNLTDGGVQQAGYTLNPKTGLPYAPQVVNRGDFTRILAEYWADGPESETPPGHWFTILNYVSDNSAFEKRWRGTGPILSDLEWDVRSYFALGGAMHDAAITCWSHKGWYDYVRPISALRYMATQGQCTDTLASDFSPLGIPLLTGFTERVLAGDPLAGFSNEHLGKIKIKAWRGPDYIFNPATDMAGVDWILLERWWPYQRPTFVTPPFAGYMSGHSTFSRTAAELMTLMTGDEYFPGGMGEFLAPMNSYLQFEEGPSQDITLQWATYRDASDQCSLSRIWGGIHPPCDDIPGRKLGIVLGPQAFHYAEGFMDANGMPDVTSVNVSPSVLTEANEGSNAFTITIQYEKGMDTLTAPLISFPVENPLANSLVLNVANSHWTNTYTYVASYDLLASSYEILNDIDIQISNAKDVDNTTQAVFTATDKFSIQTKGPSVVALTASVNTIADTNVGNGTFNLTVTFDENADTTNLPSISFPNENPMAQSLSVASAAWLNTSTFQAVYNVADANELLANIDVRVVGAMNGLGNHQLVFDTLDVFNIDTRNAQVLSIVPSAPLINDALVVSAVPFCIDMNFDMDMDMTSTPSVSFPNENPSSTLPTISTSNSAWLNATDYRICYLPSDNNQNLLDVDVAVSNAKNTAGNTQMSGSAANVFDIDTRNPTALQVSLNDYTLDNSNIGSNALGITLQFSEPMNTSSAVPVLFPVENPLTNLLAYNAGTSAWTNNTTFVASYDLLYYPDTLNAIDLNCITAQDLAGNTLVPVSMTNVFDIAIQDTSGVGTSEPFADGQLRLYPNPVKAGTTIHLTMPNNLDNALLEVSNLSGQVVQRLSAGQSSANFDLSTTNLEAGVYLVRIISNGQDWVTKLVVF